MSNKIKPKEVLLLENIRFNKQEETNDASFSKELAKTGDAEKRMILAEYGLKVKNEAALGVAADLTAS